MQIFVNWIGVGWQSSMTESYGIDEENIDGRNFGSVEFKSNYDLLFEFSAEEEEGGFSSF